MRNRNIIPAAALTLLIGGSLIHVSVGSRAAGVIWMIGLLLTGAPVVYRTLAAAAAGRFATDVVASLAIIGSVALGQPVAGLVIVLMQTGGEALERYAEGRASAALRALEQAAPRRAHRVGGDAIEEVDAALVAPGDVLMVRPGELVPCDGVVVEGRSQLDTSSITGEPMPVSVEAGTHIMSGSLNGFRAFTMQATARAAESQYARIVGLVRSAQASKAPIQRVADRYAIWFTPATLVVCAAVFLATHDWLRTLAVLVVATPCPLILAAPVAIIGGINRAARRHIIVRHGGALEKLGQVDIAVFDKTGTITVGAPRLASVNVAPGFRREDVLRMAAAMEQGSSHLLGRVLVAAAEHEGITHPRGAEHTEVPGFGVTGRIDGHTVRVGARAFVLESCDNGVNVAPQLEGEESNLRAYAAVDGCLAAVFEFADELRPELAGVLTQLRERGIRRFVLLSGDHAPTVRAFAAHAGIAETYGDLLPGDKANFIERLRSEGKGVMMVGDGVNDAPALTMADVGVALASHGRGGGITTEAADVVLLVDSLARLSDAIDIGVRSLRIARQSIVVGLALSGIAMIVAAAGGFTPAAGAALQEIIDVAVILNALRSAGEPLFSPRTHGAAPSSAHIEATDAAAPDAERPVPALRAS
jgi:heavy metal translocating P-type ATPase